MTWCGHLGGSGSTQKWEKEKFVLVNCLCSGELGRENGVSTSGGPLWPGKPGEGSDGRKGE